MSKRVRRVIGLLFGSLLLWLFPKLAKAIGDSTGGDSGE